MSSCIAGRGRVVFWFQEFGESGAGTLSPTFGPVSLPPGIHRPSSAMQGRTRTMAEDEEEGDNEPARAPAVGGQSSTARLSTRSLGIEAIALLRRYLYRWSRFCLYRRWIERHQEYQVSYADIVMEHSRQLGVLERMYRVVDWARLYGLRERQQPQGRERRPYVVGPSSRPVTSLRDMQQWMAEAGGEQQPGE